MKRILPIMIAVVSLLVTGACSSDSGGGSSASTPSSGSGSSSDPYEIDVGTTNAGEVDGIDGAWYEFTTSEDGYYQATISNTNGTSDLAFYLYDANGDYVATCDETWTGNESCSSRDAAFILLSGYTFPIQVYNWSTSSSSYYFLVAVD